MEAAPFHGEMADGPHGGAAHWIVAEDGTRLRAAHYPEGDAGTVLLYPGRTEYCEKYGRAATEFRRRGYAMATIDWRGQGLSPRRDPRSLVGHVETFADFQKDARALTTYAQELDLPRPFYLCAHSMGGAIGLRALLSGLDVRSAAFSAPMWGIRMHPLARPLAHAISYTGTAVGRGDRQMPFTPGKSYIEAAPFDGNLLTGDAEMFGYMRAHLDKVPDLALGGPSMAWLHGALGELRQMMRATPPAIPCLAAVGSREEIVVPDTIRDRLANWPGGRFELFAEARHEIMMEAPTTRNRFFDMMAEHFDANALAGPD